MERRDFLKNLGLGVAASMVAGKSIAGEITKTMNSAMEQFNTHEFPALPFAYDALEPYIDARTMELHYDKHHRTYFNNFVNAIKGTQYDAMPIDKIFASVSTAGDAIRNNGGGFYNHALFWNNLSAKSAGPTPQVSEALNKAFGSFDKFKDMFSNAAKTRFGSGWAWLYVNTDRVLSIGSTPNQDNMLMDISPIKGTPLLALDVWEHAYYLKYQNRRPEYIDAFWNVINWEEINKRYQQAFK